MKESRPVLVTTEQTKQSPLLVIDKKGTLSLPLVKQLHEQFLTVFATGVDVPISRQIIHIPYRKKIPRIPDSTYSHMFVFYNGEPEILDMLPALAKKANETGGKLLFITGLTQTSAQLFRRLEHHLYYHVNIIVYGEIFAPNGKDHNIVTMFLHQAKKLGKITIPNDGIGKLYPVLLDDVFSAIIATAFSSEKRPRLLCVFPSHPVSELSIARMLQKQDPLLQLDFKKYKGSPPDYYIPKDAIYFYPEYPLEQRLRSVTDSFLLPAPAKERQKNKKYVFPRQKREFSFRVFWYVLLTVLVLPILFTGFVGVSGVGALQLSIGEIEKGNISAAAQYASIGRDALNIAETTGSSLFYLDPFVKEQKDGFLKQLHVAKQLATTEVEVLHAVLLLQNVSEGKSSNPKKDFQEALATIKNALITLQKMRAEGELPRRITTKLTSFDSLFPLAGTIDALPSIVGFDGKRTYLVLFQNNMELRPGGGFIGSYGLLELDQGRVKEFTVHDVYDADGRLTVHVEPPYGLRRYLGASHWFLRDSNFAIDFPKNAKQAQTFLQLETGEVVDGVIALDTTFLTYLLKATGPVTVHDYKEVVTDENFYLRTQTHAEKDFFPGSTQKKDFLHSLVASLQEKLRQKEGVNHQVLVQNIGEAIAQKHVLFVFNDEAVQQLFAVNNISGSLVDVREKNQQTYLDFLGVVDSNVGINKVNYYLTRSIEQKVALDMQGRLIATASATYTNTSKKDSPFGGDYKNYVRFVLPADVVLHRVTVDGIIQSTTDAITDPEVFTAEDFSTPKELEVEKSQEKGKEVVGFLVLVPAGKSKTVTLTYELPNAFNRNASSFTYDLKLFKQPGTGDDAYSFSFAYPPSYQVVRKGTLLSDVGGKLVYSDVLSTDKEIIVEFSKK